MSKDLMHDIFLMFNPWWGKTIGVVSGYLFAGPAGAVFGLLLGNIIDKSILSYMYNPRWYHYRQESTEIKNLFVQALFKTMGHIAKSDGLISEADIQMARTIMREMRLIGTHKREAMNYYNAGKAANFNLGRTLQLINALCQHNPPLVKLFVDTILRVSHVDGQHAHKQQQVNIVLSRLGFKTVGGDHRESWQQQRQERNNYQAPTPETVSDYALLGVSPKAKKNDIKRAYRKKISQIHPDKLIARGAGKAKIDEATRMTQKLQAAYDRIKKAKGF